MQAEKIYKKAKKLMALCRDNGVNYTVVIMKPEVGLGTTAMYMPDLGEDGDLKMLAILLSDGMKYIGRDEDETLRKLKGYLGWARVQFAKLEAEKEEE